METLNPQTAILLVGLVIVSIVFVPSFLVFAYVHLKSNQFSITDPASYGIVTALVVFAIGFPVVLIEPSFLAQLPSILLPIVGLCMLALMGYLMVRSLQKWLFRWFLHRHSVRRLATWPSDSLCKTARKGRIFRPF